MSDQTNVQAKNTLTLAELKNAYFDFLVDGAFDNPQFQQHDLVYEELSVKQIQDEFNEGSIYVRS